MYRRWERIYGTGRKILLSRWVGTNIQIVDMVSGRV